MNKISAEALSKAGDKYLGRKYTEMDCQKFAETCMEDVGLVMDLGGSNSWFREMTWRGTPEECIKVFGSIPKGALLFIREFDGKEPAKYRQDGLGNASHMGIKTGRTGADMVESAMQQGNENAGKYNFGDGAIHSSATKEHVATSKFLDKTIKNGGWNMIGLYDKFTYGDKIDGILSGSGGTPVPDTSGDVPPAEDEGGDDMSEVTFGIVDPGEGETVFLRRTPNQADNIWSRIPKGNVIEIDGKTTKKGKTWYHGTAEDIDGKRKTGYMMADFVRLEEPQAGDESGQMDPGDGFPDSDADQGEFVTVTLPAADVASLLEILEKIASQVGRG